MQIEWGLIQSAITAGAGLGGVWLGGRLTWKREETRERARELKEATYLAILVVAHLDRFANACLHVAFDDGTEEGRPAGTQGCWAPTVSPPAFDPLSFKVNWKALTSDLMYDVLGMPYRIEQLEQDILEVYEHDGPPDYSEYFCKRRHGWALLGLEFSELARRLRAHAGLPALPERPDSWNRDDQLREIRDKMEREKKASSAWR
jgi:hypothetical protein